MSTPHDLEAERFAVALGGYLSCLKLQGHTIPAARWWLDMEQRVASPPVRFGWPSRWHATRSTSCCPEVGFHTVAKAADHAREATHMAALFGAPERQIEDVTKAIRRAYDATSKLAIDPADAAAASTALSHGRDDVTELWYAGVHPRTVVDIHDRLGITGRLPAQFYLGVLTRGTDLAWVSNTLSAVELDSSELEPAPHASGLLMGRPSHDSIFSWLTWTQAAWDERDPGARGRWLAAGVSRPMILILGKAGYDPDEVVSLARSQRRPPDGAARQIEGWLSAGLRPDVEDLIRLHESGLGPHWYVPSQAAVARLRSELGEAAKDTPDTQLALRIAVAGTVPDAAATWNSEHTLW